MKIIFGLKLRQLRMERGLLFDELARKSGISASYLNEIEKGKKYPKTEKIKALAAALDTTEEELKSEELSGSLAPIGDLLRSKFLSELPLHLFGIDRAKVIQMIADAPKHVGAFISTLVELSRNYAVQEGNFYHRAMRAFQELNLNYFENIEKAASDFLDLHGLARGTAISEKALSKLLIQKHQYRIHYDGLAAHPELQFLRAVFLPKTKELLLNKRLTKTQRCFQMAKELGYHFLGIEARAYTSSLLRVKRFDDVYNHFKVSYFAAAVLIDEQALVSDLRQMFAHTKWTPALLQQLLDKYEVSPQMLLHRIVSILPKHFGLSRLYLIRCTLDKKTQQFKIDRELHLHHSHYPHSNELQEHYCRRWQNIRLSKHLFHGGSQDHSHALIGAQRIRYFDTDEAYLTFSLTQPAYSSDHHIVSVTLGLLEDDKLKEVVNFWKDEHIHFEIVNVTCERCAISDCAERAVPARFIAEKQKKLAIQKKLDELISSSS